MPEYADVPSTMLDPLRAICLGLPEAHEEQAWTGRRWRIRKRTFAHVRTIDSPSGQATIVTFRSSGRELEALQTSGHPFFPGPPGTTVIGMVLDEGVDWDEVSELMSESYCMLAPKKLAARLDRPSAD
jgi:predicted DNA-binding protein (MmcQ/YjbR family)